MRSELDGFCAMIRRWGEARFCQGLWALWWHVGLPNDACFHGFSALSKRYFMRKIFYQLCCFRSKTLTATLHVPISPKGTASLPAAMVLPSHEDTDIDIRKGCAFSAMLHFVIIDSFAFLAMAVTVLFDLRAQSAGRYAHVNSLAFGGQFHFSVPLEFTTGRSRHRPRQWGLSRF